MRIETFGPPARMLSDGWLSARAQVTAAALKAARVVLEDGSSVAVEAAAQRLDDLIGAEDPFCGEGVVRQLTRPFVDLPTEAAELQSWAI